MQCSRIRLPEHAVSALSGFIHLLNASQQPATAGI